MTTDKQAAGATAGRPSPPELADLIDRVLDKGLVTDSYAPVSMLGVGLFNIASRRFMVAASESGLPPAIWGGQQPRR